jgi:hypothetical protein
MFDPLPDKDAKPIAYLKRFFVVFCSACLVVGLISAYRAWFQVHGLRLTSGDRILRSGSTVQTEVASYGRTFVTVRIELIQGEHSETLALQRVSPNDWASFDPRIRREAQTVVLTPEVLARFSPGAASVRATALGGPQWTRTPPPVVREIGVEIRRD